MPSSSCVSATCALGPDFSPDRHRLGLPCRAVSRVAVRPESDRAVRATETSDSAFSKLPFPCWGVVLLKDNLAVFPALHRKKWACMDAQLILVLTSEFTLHSWVEYVLGTVCYKAKVALAYNSGFTYIVGLHNACTAFLDEFNPENGTNMDHAFKLRT
jgi:hypothetical protein